MTEPIYGEPDRGDWLRAPVGGILLPTREEPDAPRPQVDREGARQEDQVEEAQAVPLDERVDERRPGKEEEPAEEPDPRPEGGLPDGLIVRPSGKDRETRQDGTEDRHHQTQPPSWPWSSCPANGLTVLLGLDGKLPSQYAAIETAGRRQLRTDGSYFGYRPFTVGAIVPSGPRPRSVAPRGRHQSLEEREP